jgi:hypothetical protein
VGVLEKKNMTRIVQLPSVGVEHLGTRPNHAHEPGVAPDAPAIRTDAVYVLHTTVDETLAAIRVASGFANALEMPVTVVHSRAVPYPLAVETPTGISPIETEEFVERLRAEGLNAKIRVYLCRNERQAVPAVFKRHSLIVIAGNRRWWPTRSQRMRRMLEAAGHFVVFVDGSEPDAGSPREARRPSNATAETKETSHA